VADEEDGGGEDHKEELRRMDNMRVEDVIRAGHAALLKVLTAKIVAGTATHQEMAILRNLLRDNGMTLGVPPEGQSPGVDVPRDFPTYPDVEDYEHK